MPLQIYNHFVSSGTKDWSFYYDGVATFACVASQSVGTDIKIAL